MIRSFMLMLGFFTRLPVPMTEYTEERYMRGIPLLPLVGALTGGLLSCVLPLGRFIPVPAVSLAVFAAYLLISGGIHMDGLADSCDALFSGRDRETMLEIMKDPRSGSFGVLGLIAASSSYLVLLSYAPAPAVFLFPVIGKCAPAIAANCAEYIRPKGMAEVFCRGAGKGVLALSLALALGACAAFGVRYAAAALAAFAVCAALALRVRRVLGGITGDILGLACELSQIAFLFAAMFEF